jgi:hypothetical protein
MQLSHTPGRLSVEFDEPNLVASAGLVLALAQQAGPHDLADNHLTVPGDKGAAGKRSRRVAHLTTCRETASPRKDETEPSSRPARRLPPTHTIRTQQNHHLKPATPSPSVDPG